MINSDSGWLLVLIGLVFLQLAHFRFRNPGVLLLGSVNLFKLEDRYRKPGPTVFRLGALVTMVGLAVVLVARYA